MKRIRPLRGLALVGLLLGRGILAQSVPGSDIGVSASASSSAARQAQVYAVAGIGKAAPFRVPQVRLLNAAVAGRINRELRRRLLSTLR